MSVYGTCAEVVDDGAQVCGQLVTDEVSWDIRPDGTRGGVTHRVCSDCADWLMGSGANWLKPTRRAVGGAR